jgi:hypothetical protein
VVDAVVNMYRDIADIKMKKAILPVSCITYSSPPCSFRSTLPTSEAHLYHRCQARKVIICNSYTLALRFDPSGHVRHLA